MAVPSHTGCASRGAEWGLLGMGWSRRSNDNQAELAIKSTSRAFWWCQFVGTCLPDNVDPRGPKRK
jgi:hypothetical protein